MCRSVTVSSLCALQHTETEYRIQKTDDKTERQSVSCVCSVRDRQQETVPHDVKNNK